MKHIHPLLLIVACALPACSDDDPANAGAGGQGGSETPDLDALYACRDVSFQVFRPLASEHFDPAQGGLLSAAPQASYIVHSTQIFVKEDKMPDFLQTNATVTAQLDQTEGMIAYSLAGDAGCGDLRTLGIWASEQAMYAFVGSGAHAQAMTQVNELALTGRVTHWTATAEEVNALDWPTAMDKIADVDPLAGY